MRVLVDEDLPRLAADLLRERGYEAEHVTNIGLGGQPDQQVFAVAQSQGAVLLTADLDFSNLQRFPLGSHHGIVVLRFPDYFRRGQIVDLITRFLDCADLGSLVGALVIVEPGTYRVRRP